jgi:hypothetical protein
MAVKIPGRLVGEDDGRPGHERARDRHTLHLSARQFGRPVTGPVAEADPLQELLGACVRRPRRHTVEHQRQRHVLDRGQHGHQIEELEHESEVAPPERSPRASAHRPHVLTGDGHSAVVRRIEPAGDVQEGRFAGSRWSGHDDEFACVQSEVETDEHIQLLVTSTVPLGDALELQYRGHRVAAIVESARRPRVSS